MEPAQSSGSRWQNCLFREAKGYNWNWQGELRALILLLIFCLLSTSAGAQAAGSIATRYLPFVGASVIDSAGNAYTVGACSDDCTVTSGAAQTQSGGGTCTENAFPVGPISVPCVAAYVIKVDAAGNTIFATLLGGQTNDSATALAVDAAGEVYFTGTTGGSLPTTPNAAIPVSTSSTLFAAKLSADGSHLIYCTYLPNDAGNPTAVAGASAIAIDAQGDSYITGYTSTHHAYVTKLSADGSTVPYTVEFAGTGQEAGLAIAVDPAGNAIVTGYTSSPDFPVSAGAVQTQFGGNEGFNNAFVTKLDPSGDILFSTFLGGTGPDSGSAIQTDSTGNIFVAGTTGSSNFPTTPGTFEPTSLVPLWSTSPGAFLAKLAPDGSALAYSTYVPVTSVFLGNSPLLAVTPTGEAYLAGLSGAGFPVTASAPQPCFGAIEDALVTHFDGNGSLLDATYLGGPPNLNLLESFSIVGDGSVLLAWHNAGPGMGLSQITFGGPGWSAPACMSPDVLNSAIFSSLGLVSPGEFVSLTGFGIGPQAGVSYQPNAQGGVPLELSGVKVFFGDQQAPVIYAQSQQVNALAPFELIPGSTTTVTLEYNGATFGSVSVPVNAGTPGLFRAQPNVSAQAYAVNQDGTINGPSNPASAGSVVALWGTGFGPIGPACATGALNPSMAVNLAQGYGAAFEEQTPVLYAGSAPTLLCGVVQINIQVPADAMSGAYALQPWAVVPQTLTANDPNSESIIFVK